MARESIAIQRLQPGLFIELPLSWSEHPFPMDRLKIKDDEQINIIRQRGLKQVWYFPDKSDALPKPESTQPEVAPAAPSAEDMQTQWDKKKEMTETLRRRRREIQAVE